MSRDIQYRIRKQQDLRYIYIYLYNSGKTMRELWTNHGHGGRICMKLRLNLDLRSLQHLQSGPIVRNKDGIWKSPMFLWIMFPFKFGSKFASSNFRFRSFMILICVNNKSHEFTHIETTHNLSENIRKTIVTCMYIYIYIYIIYCIYIYMGKL